MRKSKRKTISGKGYCMCENRNYVHGKGIMDVIKSIATPVINFATDNKDTIKSGVEAISNVVKLGDSTKTIIQEIMKKRKPKIELVHDGISTENTLKDIVDKINQFKVGSGFAYI